MAGQVTYHLLAQAGTTRTPWAITTLVSCLPVLVLGMGTALAHMLHADAAAADMPGGGATGPAILRSPAWSPQDQVGPGQDQAARHQAPAGSGPPARTTLSPRQDHSTTARTTRPAPPAVQPQMNQAHFIARRLAAEGKPVSRRALRNGRARGSNQALNTLARKVNAERAANPHQA
jgi:hypothetical protein